MEEVKDWLGLAAVTISVGGCIYAWLTARSKGNSEHLKKVDESLKAHDRRIQTVESEIQHLPSKDNHHKLEVAIAEMNGDIKTMTANLERITRTTGRMEDFLMRGDK